MPEVIGSVTKRTTGFRSPPMLPQPQIRRIGAINGRQQSPSGRARTTFGSKDFGKNHGVNLVERSLSFKVVTGHKISPFLKSFDNVPREHRGTSNGHVKTTSGRNDLSAGACRPSKVLQGKGQGDGRPGSGKGVRVPQSPGKTTKSVGGEDVSRRMVSGGKPSFSGPSEDGGRSRFETRVIGDRQGEQGDMGRDSPSIDSTRPDNLPHQPDKLLGRRPGVLHSIQGQRGDAPDVQRRGTSGEVLLETRGSGLGSTEARVQDRGSFGAGQAEINSQITHGVLKFKGNGVRTNVMTDAFGNDFRGGKQKTFVRGKGHPADNLNFMLGGVNGRGDTPDGGVIIGALDVHSKVVNMKRNRGLSFHRILQQNRADANMTETVFDGLNGWRQSRPEFIGSGRGASSNPTTGPDSGTDKPRIGEAPGCDVRQQGICQDLGGYPAERAALIRSE